MFGNFKAIKLIILYVCCVQISNARSYNLDGAHFLVKRQPFYDYYDSSPGLYDSDGDMCPRLMGVRLLGGTERLFSTVVVNDKVLIINDYYFGQPENELAHFSIDILKVSEVESFDCPVIEAEIRVRPDLTDVKCSLLWDLGGFPAIGVSFFLHLVCRGADKPDSNVENNPNRVVTLIPHKITSAAGEEFVYYKICPGGKMTCKGMRIAVAEFARVPKHLTYLYNDY